MQKQNKTLSVYFQKRQNYVNVYMLSIIYLCMYLFIYLFIRCMYLLVYHARDDLEPEIVRRHVTLILGTPDTHQQISF